MIQGDWKNDKAHGEGELYHISGYVVTGRWVDNLINGKGILVDKHGNRFEGIFLNDQKEGKGTEMFVNRTEYRGEYRANMFNGKGIFTWPDGSSYEGDWVDNKMNGKVQQAILIIGNSYNC